MEIQAPGKLKTMRWKLILYALLCMLINGASFATITLTQITSPAFGLIIGGASGRQFVLNTSGSISGTNAADHLGGQVAGNITVADDLAASAIEILADSIVTSGGITVNQVLCSYNNGTQTRCDGSALVVPLSQSSAPLRIGIDITTSQVHQGGNTATVDMNINVTYQ